MKTNGLVRGAFVCLSLMPLTHLAAQEITRLPDDFESAISYQIDDDEPAIEEVIAVDEVESYDVDSSVFSQMFANSFWIAGTEITILDIDSRPGGLITVSYDDSGTAGTDASFRDGTAVQGYEYAPRVWLGRQVTNNLAVVARYWELNGGDVGVPPQTPGTVMQPNFATFVDINTVGAKAFDLEAIVSVYPGLWKIDGFVGARHASFEANTTFYGFGVFTTGNFINTYYQVYDSFKGDGVTYGLSMRRAIGTTGIYFFTTARGSYIGGTGFGLGRASGTVASSPSAPLVGAATVTRTDRQAEMRIGELQAGFVWERELAFIPANAFFRVAFEYQDWQVDMRPIGGAGFGGTIGTLTTNSFASTNGDGGFTAMGLAIATGFTW